MVRPVRGLRTVRALRRAAENVPKPTRVTVSPRLSAVRMPASIDRTARSATVWDQPVVVAMRLMISARVTLHAQRGAGLVHHLVGDSRVPLALGIALDRLARHGPDERGDA